MSKRERDRIRASLVTYMEQGRSPRLSPYSTQSPYVFLSLQQGSRALAFLLILVMVVGSGGSLSLAASRSLPGDLLYPVKLSVNEELAVSFAGSVEKKAEVQKARIKTRLEEATTLKASGKFTPTNTEIVQKAFVDQAKELNTTIDSLQESGDEETVLAVTQDLLPTLVSFKEASTTLVMTNEPVATIDGTTIDSLLVTTEPISISSDTEGPIESTAVATSEKVTITDMEVPTSLSLDTIVAREVAYMQLQQAETLEKIKIIDSLSPSEKPESSIDTTIVSPEITSPEEVIREVVSSENSTSLTQEDPLLIETPIDTLGDVSPMAMIESGEPISSSLIAEKSTLPSPLNEVQTKTTSSLNGTIYLAKPCLSVPCTVEVDNSFTRSLLVYTEDKSEIIAQIKVTEGGLFSATLEPGTYVVDLLKNGSDTTDDLPETITIPSSGSVVLSVTVNTK
jgi:hypothetical protein